jgi:hypothetical protein
LHSWPARAPARPRSRPPARTGPSTLAARTATTTPRLTRSTRRTSALKLVWEYHSGDFGQMQCNPIIVDGSALRGDRRRARSSPWTPATGRQLWRFTTRGTSSRFDNDRGVTYWTDGTSERILCTVGLLALRPRREDRRADPGLRDERQGQPQGRASGRRRRRSSSTRRRRGPSSGTSSSCRRGWARTRTRRPGGSRPSM